MKEAAKSSLDDLVGNRTEEAISVIDSCKGRFGLYASSDLYRHEHWTRDISYSLDGLLEAGYGKEVKNDLESIWIKQKKGGKAPVLYVDKVLPWALNSIKRGRLASLFRRASGIKAVLNAVQHTADPTLHAIAAMYEYAKNTGDVDMLSRFKSGLSKAIAYTEERLVDGFVVGCDWRDLMPELKNDRLLSNQCLLYRVYELSGEHEKAEKLKNRINEKFWNGEYYVSGLDSKDFDALGASLAIVWGIVPRERYGQLAEMFRKTTTKYGIKNMLIMDEKTMGKKAGIPECDHYGKIWPFVSYTAVLALKKMGFEEFAHAEMDKLEKLEGFNEWYDPDSGKPRGSRGQLWSAATYIDAVEKMGTSTSDTAHLSNNRIPITAR